uniref:Protein CASC3 n=1 Tax=Acrobeloides nanus TaxID=290746 RepID=A0A914C9P5_9BILA
MSEGEQSNKAESQEKEANSTPLETSEKISDSNTEEKKADEDSHKIEEKNETQKDDKPQEKIEEKTETETTTQESHREETPKLPDSETTTTSPESESKQEESTEKDKPQPVEVKVEETNKEEQKSPEDSPVKETAQQESEQIEKTEQNKNGGSADEVTERKSNETMTSGENQNEDGNWGETPLSQNNSFEGEEGVDAEEQANEPIVRQESKDEDKDDDEKVDSPAYIPRKGNFYLHDMRTALDEAVEETKDSKTDKPSRADRKWEHDLFDSSNQRPKSTQELVRRYGRNIRESTSPPTAEEVGNRPTQGNPREPTAPRHEKKDSYERREPYKSFSQTNTGGRGGGFRRQENRENYQSASSQARPKANYVGSKRFVDDRGDERGEQKPPMRNFGTSEHYQGRNGNIRGRADNREPTRERNYIGEREYEHERKPPMRNFGTSENYRGRVGNIRGRADNREHIYVGEREYEYEREPSTRASIPSEHYKGREDFTSRDQGQEYEQKSQMRTFLPSNRRGHNRTRGRGSFSRGVPRGAGVGAVQYRRTIVSSRYSENRGVRGARRGTSNRRSDEGHDYERAPQREQRNIRRSLDDEYEHEQSSHDDRRYNREPQNRAGGNRPGKRYTAQRPAAGGESHEDDRPYQNQGYENRSRQQYNQGNYQNENRGPRSNQYQHQQQNGLIQGSSHQQSMQQRQSRQNRAPIPSLVPQYGSGPTYANPTMGYRMPAPATVEQNYPHPRQPTEAVYFDPIQQVNVTRGPPPSRERRRLEIVPPSQK